MLGSNTNKWQQLIWIGAAVALLGIIGSLVWFVGTSVSELVDLLKRQNKVGSTFTLNGIALVTLTLIRMLAILLGGAIAFAGLAVSFFTHHVETTIGSSVNRDEKGATMTLATYSPGIVAMIIGAAIIVFALVTKTNFSSNEPSARVTGTNQHHVPAKRVPRSIDELPQQIDAPKTTE